MSRASQILKIALQEQKSRVLPKPEAHREPANAFLKLYETCSNRNNLAQSNHAVYHALEPYIESVPVAAGLGDVVIYAKDQLDEALAQSAIRLDYGYNKLRKAHIIRGILESKPRPPTAKPSPESTPASEDDNAQVNKYYASLTKRGNHESVEEVKVDRNRLDKLIGKLNE